MHMVVMPQMRVGKDPASNVVYSALESSFTLRAFVGSDSEVVRTSCALSPDKTSLS